MRRRRRRWTLGKRCAALLAPTGAAEVLAALGGLVTLALHPAAARPLTAPPPHRPQALTARRAAIEEVERLLQRPEDLQRLDALQAEAAARRAANTAQLSAALAAQIDLTCEGLEALERARGALRRLQAGLARIDALCEECAALIDCHEKVRRLAGVHHNLRRALRDAEAIAALPGMARDAEELLGGGAGLVPVYICLATLEGVALKAQVALASASVLPSSAASSSGAAAVGAAAAAAAAPLGAYFEQVQRGMGRLEERLWATVRAYKALARDRPAALVAALQVVEMQEAVDAALRAAGGPQARLRKAWRARALSHVAAAATEAFAPLLQRCSRLAAADGAPPGALAALLAEADAFVAELADARARVAPCFPPRYRVFAFIAAEYRRQIGSVLDLVGASAPRLSNADALAALAWAARYHAALAALGAEAPADAPATATNASRPSGEAGVAALLDTYGVRLAATLSAWLSNLLEADFAAAPRTTGEGRVWTPGAVDLFRILEEQLAVAEAAGAGAPLLARVADEATRAVGAFQAAARARLGAPPAELSLEHVAALGNNCLRCRALAAAFARRVGALRLGVAAQESAEGAARGFRRLAREAAAAAVGVVFSDPGFGELFARVGCSDEWRAGVATGSVLATLDDFMGDFQRWLEPPLAARLAAALLAETVAHFAAAALTHLRAVRDEDLRALRRDAAKVAAFYGRFLPPEAARRAAQPLADVCEFLASDSEEAFVLSYTALLQSAPGVTPALLANLLAARVAADAEMTRADGREILEACRQVYASRARGGGAGGAEAPPHAAVGRGKSAAFAAAVLACRAPPPGGGDEDEDDDEAAI